MALKKSNRAITIAIMSMIGTNSHAVDYTYTNYQTSINGVLSDNNSFNNSTVIFDDIAIGTPATVVTFTGNSTLSITAQDAVSQGGFYFTQGTIVNIDAEQGIAYGDFEYTDSVVLNLNERNAIGGGGHFAIGSSVINLNTNRALTGGDFTLAQGATINLNAQDALNNFRLFVTQGATMNVTTRSIGYDSEVRFSDAARLNVLANDSIFTGELIFNGISAMNADTTNGVTGGNQTFNNSATLHINAVAGIAGGNQTFNGSSKLEVHSLNAITGGSQIFNDTSQLLIQGSGSLNGGSLTFNDAAAVILGMDNLTYDLRGASLNLVTTSNALNLGSGNTVMVSDVTGQGAIINMGTSVSELILENNADITYGGFIGGVGGVKVTKSGTGNLDFRGNLTSIEDLTISNGIFSNNGSINANSIVGANATAGGNGVWQALEILNGGIFAPGNSIGSTIVTNNLTLNPGSTYLVEIDDQGNSDFVNVLGTANLAGNVHLLGGTGNYSSGMAYNILTGQGGVAGTFDNATTDLAFMTVDITINGNDVIATLLANSTVTPGVVANNYDGNSNQQNVAGSFTTFPSTAIENAMLGLTGQSALQAFTQLGGEIHADTQAGLIEDSDLLRGSVLQRLVNPDGNDVWMKVINTNAYTGRTAINDDVTRRANVALFGIDRKIGSSAEWLAGAVAGYGNTTTSALQSDARIDTFHIGAYVGRAWDSLNFKFGLGYSYHDIESQRRLNFGIFNSKAKADYQAQSLQAFADIGYRIFTGTGTVEPFISIAGVQVYRDSFKEAKSDAALDVRSESSFTTLTTAGVRLSQPLLRYRNVDIALQGSLGYRHADGDITPTSKQNLVNGSVFQIQGNAIARNAVVYDIGFKADLTSNIVAGLGYRGLDGDNVRSHTTSAYLNWMF